VTLPNLAGVATKDLVEKIGTGKFSAAYINWSRTLHLLREHAPGWTASCITADDGGLLHKAPVGAYLLIQFVHTDGSETPAIPQAVMDHRNNAIPYEKITARDITDTQRRGTCMAAAFVFGLAYELWAKMPLESGYAPAGGDDAPKAAPTASKATAAVVKESKAEGATEATFREAALAKGFTTFAIDGLLGIIKGDYAKGVATVAKKTADEVEALNTKFAPASDEDGSGW